MQTNFSESQLLDPDVRESEKILRKCVHCGFCTATCPTFVLLGDELDSPRGRIYLIKDMLENDRPATEPVVRHIDRCLSCHSCMTTCPSGVNYMHLVDHARHHIEETYRRPLMDRWIRVALALTIPFPRRFRLLMQLAKVSRLAAFCLPGKLRGMLSFIPQGRLSAPLTGSRVNRANPGPSRKRIILLAGCVQQVLDPRINEATVRLLNRHGCDVLISGDAGCCGAATHHLGKTEAARESARRNVRAWKRELEDNGLDAIVVNASGCGTMVKDYGHLLRNDDAYSEDAARIAGLARDISEVLADLDLSFSDDADSLRVTYHGPCSLRHGQKITRQPVELLSAAGYTVGEPAEAHLCCGSAGTYNLLQPEIAVRLRDRKAEEIRKTVPEVVATANIGCIVQLRDAVDVPVLHMVELLDWATGGPRPEILDTGSAGG